MPLSTNIKLPKSVVPIFPDRCVACGFEHPGGFYRASTNAVGWWSFTFWSFGAKFSADVPACGTCSTQLRTQRLVRLAVLSAFVAVGLIVGFTLLERYHGPFKRWLVTGIAIVAVLPVLLWETLFPPPIDLTAYSETVSYEFRNATYGEEFAELNGVEVDEED
jgi:hypothetical protein